MPRSIEYAMNYELTQHARDALQERQIPVEWMERVIAKPAFSAAQPAGPGGGEPFGEDSRAWRPGDARGGKQDGCSRTGRERIFRPHDERQIMRLKIDREADALYLRLDESPIIESEEVSPGVVLDFNEQNQVVGVEMLNLSKRAPGLNLKELQFQTA
jgi:uncharacterized protein YuzE